MRREKSRVKKTKVEGGKRSMIAKEKKKIRRVEKERQMVERILIERKK